MQQLPAHAKDLDKTSKEAWNNGTTTYLKITELLHSRGINLRFVFIANLNNSN
jgi:hypothetical protein